MAAMIVDYLCALAMVLLWPPGQEDALAKLLELNLTHAGAAQDPEPGEATDHED